MSTDIKALHTWTIELTREVEETTTETRDGQEAKVTRKVKKAVPTEMALKQPSRRELRQADLFYGTEVNRFMSMGFLQRSIVANKHMDLTGGVLSGKERLDAARLSARSVELERDLVSMNDGTAEEKEKIQTELAAVKTEISNIIALNESVFSQTAEARAQGQLGQWFAFFLIYIQRNGKWTPYFEGDTFEKKEEFAWGLEEKNDEFYIAAIQKILTYVHFFNRGANKPEHFKLVDVELEKEMARMRDEAKAKEAAVLAAKTAAEQPAVEPVAAVVAA